MSRAECHRCQRPVKYCYCAELTSERASVDLIILQHPKETRHPMNTARITELGLENCQIWVGEDFSSHQPLLNLLKTKHCYLLFPGPDAQDSQQLLQTEVPEVVIILDGTWRKARKIYHSNPALQTLPALSLNHDQLSDYRIRKVPDASALSTVEAAVVLLRQVSRNSSVHQPLLDAFDRMIQMQIKTMGEDVYKKNYAHRTQSQ